MGAKYNMLYPPLTERIFAEEREKKDSDKAAKTRLHQLYGAYLQGNSHKKAGAILKSDTSVIFLAEKILQLHASTKERSPYFRSFYELVAARCKNVQKILDLGCGFNPFSIPLMPDELARDLQEYHAYDIDLRTKDLLNAFFERIGLPTAAACADLITEDISETADITFMLKLIPVLEAQAPSRGYALANSLNTRFLVISFPTKSLGGRDVGMEKNYAAAFENACQTGLLNNFSQIAKEKIGNELIYLMERISK